MAIRPLADGTARPRLPSTASGTTPGAFGTREWLLLSGVALLWGSSFVLMDIGLTAFEPGLIAWLRLALGVSALSLVPRARRTPIDRSDLPRVALLGVTWMGVPLLLFPVAQQWIDSSVAGMINGAMPLTSAAWAALLLRRLPGRLATSGLVVGFAGVVLISLPEIPVGASGGTSATALGTGLAMTAAILYGLSANLAVPLQQRYGALAVLLRAQVAAFLVVTPFGLMALQGSRFAWGPALAMVPLGFLGTGLGFVLMVTLVGRVGGPRGSVATYFIPVVAILLGVLVLRETIHPAAIAGTGLVLVGAWITSRREPVAATRTGQR